MLERFKELIVQRVIKIDPNEQGTVEEIFQRRLEEWQNHQETEWKPITPNQTMCPLCTRLGTTLAKSFE